jgi:predicted TPR repeat methyltransferase
MTYDPADCDQVASEIAALYQAVAHEFDHDRSKALIEEPYLAEMLGRLGRGTNILDLGCGSGEPIARFFIEAGCSVTGVDVAPAMLDMCRARFPESQWLHCDMRSMSLGRRFDAIVAWDSFFHLTAQDQRKMFSIFQEHIEGNGLLLFTSGPSACIAIGNIYGYDLFHASLDAVEYQSLLTRYGFEVLLHVVNDPECGGHTVWLAQKC